MVSTTAISTTCPSGDAAAVGGDHVRSEQLDSGGRIRGGGDASRRGVDLFQREHQVRDAANDSEQRRDALSQHYFARQSGPKNVQERHFTRATGAAVEWTDLVQPEEVAEC